MSPLPPEVRAVARKYRLREFWDIGSIEEAATCLLSGFAFVFGWDGHSCVGTELLNEQGDFLYANSWDESWGDNGFGTLNLSAVWLQYGAFGYRTPLWS